MNNNFKFVLILRKIKIYYRDIQLQKIRMKILKIVNKEINDVNRYDIKIINPKILFDANKLIGIYSENLMKLVHNIDNEINKK